MEPETEASVRVRYIPSARGRPPVPGASFLPARLIGAPSPALFRGQLSLIMYLEEN